MTRLLFDAGETVFHFLLPSNSRYLILTGNAKLRGCYPNCSYEFSASGEQSKCEETKCWKLFPSCCLRFSSCFLKSWQLGPMLTSQCERDSKLQMSCEENPKWGGPSSSAVIRWVMDSHKHINECDIHSLTVICVTILVIKKKGKNMHMIINATANLTEKNIGFILY